VINKLSVRGKGTLHFKRKGFSVSLKEGIPVPGSNQVAPDYLKKFKLLALPFDYTYIENYLTQQLFYGHDLWNVVSFYSEVKLNGKHQRLYLLIQDPVDHAFRNKNAPYILRRGIKGNIDNDKLNKNMHTELPEFYSEKFNGIYSILATSSGEILCDSLNKIMNTDKYMKKIAIDFILCQAFGNGYRNL
jgi:hypothetical protein